MIYNKKTVFSTLLVGAIGWLVLVSMPWATAVYAQSTPRPTPTNQAAINNTATPRPTATTDPSSSATAVPNTSSSVAGTRGSIRGAIYQDANGDGQCVGTEVDGEIALVDVPIEFVSQDGEVTLYLASGSDGTFGLVDAGLGTWTVSVRPSADWVVSSASTVDVYLSDDENLALNTDFCLRPASALQSSVLPDSGAPATGGLLFIVALLAGLGFVVAGVVQRRLSLR